MNPEYVNKMKQAFPDYEAPKQVDDINRKLWSEFQKTPVIGLIEFINSNPNINLNDIVKKALELVADQKVLILNQNMADVSSQCNLNGSLSRPKLYNQLRSGQVFYLQNKSLATSGGDSSIIAEAYRQSLPQSELQRKLDQLLGPQPNPTRPPNSPTQNPRPNPGIFPSPN